MTAHISVDTGCNLGCSYCIAPETPVLMEDLTWKEIQNVKEDESVIAFDYDSPEDSRYRMYRSANVEDVHTHTAEAVDIHTDKGTITAEVNHPFYTKKYQRTGFRSSESLRSGDEIYYFADPVEYEENEDYKLGYIHGAFAGDGTVPGWKGRKTYNPSEGRNNKASYISSIDKEVNDYIIQYAEDVLPDIGFSLVDRQYSGSHSKVVPMASTPDNEAILDSLENDVRQSDDYKRGWLAGMFDADGTQPKGKSIVFAQNDGPILDRVKEYLDSLGYNWTHDAGVEGKFSDMVRIVSNGEQNNVKYRLLVEIRPKIKRKRNSFVGNNRIGGTAVIESIESRGKMELYDLTTSESTFIAGGFLSRNCYEEEDRTINGNDVTDNYDMDAIMDELEEFKERYPQEVPGLHGGEPLLLRDDDIETIFEWVYNNYESVRNGEKYTHIQTNGTLMRDKHIEMFDKYNVNVGISCDGPEELNQERKAAMREDATDRLGTLTRENIFKLGETDVPVGVIVVLHESNAGTDEKLEKLLDWMDDLNEAGISGHYNEMLPYDNISTELALSPERMKEVFLETWEWMKEESYRTWNPMRDFQDNLLGNEVTDCRQGKCDPFDAGAAKIIDGEGETSGCFDSETEILTERGWVDIPEVTERHRIATIDEKTHKMQFFNPTAIQEYEYNDEMIHWKTRAIDAMVTPNHNMFTTVSRNADWVSMKARKLAEYSEPYFKKSPSQIDESETYTPDINEVIPLDRDVVENAPSLNEYIDLLGWFVAEGRVQYNSIILTQDDESDYHEEVISTLSSFGEVKKTGKRSYRIISEPIADSFSQFTGCENKKIPQWAKRLPPSKIERLLKAMFKGDGTSKNLNDSDPDKWIKYTTTSEELANDVQELLLRIGKGATISTAEKKTKGGKTRYDVCVVHYNDRSRVTKEPERVEYSGKVYDVTVPNHTVVVRRNGMPYVSRQCGKTWSAVGDGTPFLQGPSNNTQYNDDEDREKILKQLPGAPETDGPDLGGCKGCEMWAVCHGGCPSAGIDQDHRNRTRWCESKYYLYKRIEEDMRQMFPNIKLITDLPWDAETMSLAQTGQLDIGQFDAMNSQGDGKKKSVYGGYDRNKGLPEEMIPQGVMPERSQERVIEEFKEKHGEENVTIEVDGEEVTAHADSDMGSEE